MFAAAPPGTVLTPARTRVPLAPLKPSRCRWLRETVDGEWRFERLEDAGTTWIVAHAATKTVVCDCLGSLAGCRAYVASGEAQADLERIQSGQTAGN